MPDGPVAVLVLEQECKRRRTLGENAERRPHEVAKLLQQGAVVRAAAGCRLLIDHPAKEVSRRSRRRGAGIAEREVGGRIVGAIALEGAPSRREHP
jgi:hypothetical protein